MSDTSFEVVTVKNYHPPEQRLRVKHTVKIIADYKLACDIAKSSFCGDWNPVIRSNARRSATATTAQPSTSSDVVTHITMDPKECALMFNTGSESSIKVVSKHTLTRVRTEDGAGGTSGRDHLEYTVLDVYTGREMERRLSEAVGMQLTEKNRDAWGAKVCESLKVICDSVKQKSEAKSREVFAQYKE
ncbi:hypothetical protein NM688_g7739 [Phlebia brevispora]|uniref:Uncharacterized protein n=1 Tax=Phlebia brevispora TaxID=194682 RepID=A0ACC1S1L5_9APHY|nr:hypothetical protein NM688_g7739 [Phlebia brevispora]